MAWEPVFAAELSARETLFRSFQNVEAMASPSKKGHTFLDAASTAPYETGDRASMANTKSAKKAARQALRRTEVNKSRRTRMRTAVRKAEEAITAADSKVALEALVAAQSQLMKAAQNGIVHKNTAARKISRLSKRIKALGA